jgi:hypothetical protein
MLVITVGVPMGIWAIARSGDNPQVPLTPTSSTLAPDEAARSGCHWWRNYLDGGPFFGKDELSARINYAVTRAQESSVWAVAHAAEQYDQASTMQELDAASDAFDEACASVGQ